MPRLDHACEPSSMGQRSWNGAAADDSDTAPFASFRDAIITHSMPPTWVLPAGGTISIIRDATTTDWADVQRWAPLPVDVPVEVHDRMGFGDQPLHFRLTGLEPGRDEVVLTDNNTNVHTIPSDGVWMDITTDLDTIWATTSQGTRIVTGTGTGTDTGGDTASGFTSGSLASLSVSTNVPVGGRADGAQLSVRARTTRDGAATETIVGHLWAAIDRIEGSLDDQPFATRVIATRYGEPTSTHLPADAIDLVGFVSEVWEPRRTSSLWDYRDRAGAVIDPDSLELYGRCGGLVGYVYSRSFHRQPPTQPGPASATPPLDEPLFAGPQRAWVDARRNAELTLQQLTMAWYAADQRGPIGDPAAATDTATLLALLQEQWHPAFAWNIDVIRIIVRGTNRFRFSDGDFMARAPRIITDVSSHLGAIGIAAQAVVLS